jgi:hypothetical protein
MCLSLFNCILMTVSLSLYHSDYLYAEISLSLTNFLKVIWSLRRNCYIWKSWWLKALEVYNCAVSWYCNLTRLALYLYPCSVSWWLYPYLYTRMTLPMDLYTHLDYQSSDEQNARQMTNCVMHKRMKWDKKEK